MKKILMLLTLILKINFPDSMAVDYPSEEFNEGTRLYTEGRYREALEVWLPIYKSGYRSPNLNYNIGNAYFKLNDIPHAVLFYERAILLKPADEDINYNLQIARSYTVDKFTEVPEIFLVTWYNFVSLALSSDAWAYLSISSFIFFLVLLLFYLFSAVYRFKVASFWLAVLMLLLSISSLLFSVRNRSLVYSSDKAIILCPQVNGKSSPYAGGNDLFVIHEGTKVTVTDAVGDWNEIRLPDGNKGWIPVNCLEKL